MPLNTAEPHTVPGDLSPEDPYGFDFTFVPTTARIALYDDLHSAPRVMEITPDETTQYLETLASTVYEQARAAGGSIPYTIVREVSENFIHARFREIVVSVLDNGNTIRFADQGPGIPFKDQAQKPGFSSAVEPMKKYIRGVGSGLPIVRDYLDLSHGNITIEDNLGQGSVVTISVSPVPSTPPALDGGNGKATAAQSGLQPAAQPPFPQAVQPIQPVSSGYVAAAPQPYGSANAYGQPLPTDPYRGYPQPVSYDAYGNAIPLQQAVPGTVRGYGSYAPSRGSYPSGAPASHHQIPVPPLTDREQDILRLLYQDGELGVTDLSHYTDIAQSSVHNILKKLEQAALVSNGQNKKRRLTDLGVAVAQGL